MQQRATRAPAVRSSVPAPLANPMHRRMAGMQRTSGNQAIARAIGARVLPASLPEGRSGDVFEQEAERAARAAEKPAAARTPVRGSVAQAAGAGQALSTVDRRFFEKRFGADLGGVRVHTGNAAAEAARFLGAAAFTVGADIVFAAGRYQPGSREGRGLLAHELAHVLQQTGTGNAAGIAARTWMPMVQREEPKEKPRAKDEKATDAGAKPAENALPALGKGLKHQAAFFEWWKSIAGLTGSFDAWTENPKNKLSEKESTPKGITKDMFNQLARKANISPKQDYDKMSVPQAADIAKVMWKNSGADQLDNRGVSLMVADWYWENKEEAFRGIRRALRDAGYRADPPDDKLDTQLTGVLNAIEPLKAIKLITEAWSKHNSEAFPASDKDSKDRADQRVKSRSKQAADISKEDKFLAPRERLVTDWLPHILGHKYGDEEFTEMAPGFTPAGVADNYTTCGLLPAYVARKFGLHFQDAVKPAEGRAGRAASGDKLAAEGLNAVRDLARQRGAWIKPTGNAKPKPGDIYGLAATGDIDGPLFSHVGVIVDATGTLEDKDQGAKDYRKKKQEKAAKDAVAKAKMEAKQKGKRANVKPAPPPSPAPAAKPEDKTTATGGEAAAAKTHATGSPPPAPAGSKTEIWKTGDAGQGHPKYTTTDPQDKSKIVIVPREHAALFVYREYDPVAKTLSGEGDGAPRKLAGWVDIEKYLGFRPVSKEEAAADKKRYEEEEDEKKAKAEAAEREKKERVAAARGVKPATANKIQTAAPVKPKAP